MDASDWLTVAPSVRLRKLAMSHFLHYARWPRDTLDFRKFSGNDKACQPVVPAVLPACGIPQVVEAVGRKLGKIHVGVERHLLHRGPATAELCRAGAQGTLGVDPLGARR